MIATAPKKIAIKSVIRKYYGLAAGPQKGSQRDLDSMHVVDSVAGMNMSSPSLSSPSRVP